MSASLHIPVPIRAPSPEELSKKILKVQIQQGGRVQILSIAQDLKTKDWVCFYYPIRHFNGSDL